MHITLVGIDHKTAPVSLRERLAFGAEELPDALPAIAAAFDGGVALLSTCNRTEVYLATHRTVDATLVIDKLRELKGSPEVPPDAFYHLTGRDAVRRLFLVAAGVESMVLGESEVLGQVRAAFAAATAAKTHNAVLSQLFHAAVRAGRRARSETRICRHTVSVSSTAVALAHQTLGDLAGRTVLVVGAGEAGKLTARSLAGSAESRLLVTSRTARRAREVAEDLGGKAIPFRRLKEAMAEADIVISSSAAAGFLIGRSEAKAAMAGRGDRPVLIIDIAVPRDVDPVVSRQPGVHLYDIDDLREVAEQNMNARRQEVAKVRRILEEELERFNEWVRARGVTPTVAALRARADAVREEEIARTMKRLRGITPEQRRRVEAMANALTKKLLHDPIVRLKGVDGERFAPQVRELFALDGDAPGERRDQKPEA